MFTGNSVNPSRHSVTNCDQIDSGAQGYEAGSFGIRSVASQGYAVQYMKDREALFGQRQAGLPGNRQGQSGDRLGNCSSIMPILSGSFETVARSGTDAETSTKATDGNRFNNSKYRDEWLFGSEPNSVVVATGTSFKSTYACLNGKEAPPKR